MAKNLTITLLCLVAIAIIGGWMLSKYQQGTKKSLKVQIEYTKAVNEAFSKIVEIERSEKK